MRRLVCPCVVRSPLKEGFLGIYNPILLCIFETSVKQLLQTKHVEFFLEMFFPQFVFRGPRGFPFMFVDSDSEDDDGYYFFDDDDSSSEDDFSSRGYGGGRPRNHQNRYPPRPRQPPPPPPPLSKKQMRKKEKRMRQRGMASHKFFLP